MKFIYFIFILFILGFTPKAKADNPLCADYIMVFNHILTARDSGGFSFVRKIWWDPLPDSLDQLPSQIHRIRDSELAEMRMSVGRGWGEIPADPAILAWMRVFQRDYDHYFYLGKKEPGTSANEVAGKTLFYIIVYETESWLPSNGHQARSRREENARSALQFFIRNRLRELFTPETSPEVRISVVAELLKTTVDHLTGTPTEIDLRIRTALEILDWQMVRAQSYQQFLELAKIRLDHTPGYAHSSKTAEITRILDREFDVPKT